MARVEEKDDLCAIFVHAGAGYHSRENERNHLSVCAQAADSGMTFLRNGGSAVEAVEVALMVLEDAPLTNAGYGSNLTENGRVEGDACVVDHFGRSGAVGAVPNVKNPIALARKVYERAYRTPGVNRVPPNLIVGEGAVDFAWEHGVPLVPDDDMISANARARWQTWCHDLAEYEKQNPEFARDNGWLRRPLTPLATRIARMSNCHTTESIEAQLAATRAVDEPIVDPGEMDVAREVDGPKPKPFFSNYQHPTAETETSSSEPGANVDRITDTVGAIAIDKYGNIAAGSSSGGIGMKHRGRVGPAALIGIGTHVIPADPTDPEKLTVAAVCSGTGEHIATSFGASTFASRLFFNQRRVDANQFEHVSEDEAVHGMIVREFICHPSVLNSPVDGSIGVMAVKKNEDGIGLFFAHSTDSFAIATMSSHDSGPSCLMSRNQKKGGIAQGGLMFRPAQFFNGTKRKYNGDSHPGEHE